MGDLATGLAEVLGGRRILRRWTRRSPKRDKNCELFSGQEMKVYKITMTPSPVVHRPQRARTRDDPRHLIGPPKVGEGISNTKLDAQRHRTVVKFQKREQAVRVLPLTALLNHRVRSPWYILCKSKQN